MSDQYAFDPATSGVDLYGSFSRQPNEFEMLDRAGGPAKPAPKPSRNEFEELDQGPHSLLDYGRTLATQGPLAVAEQAGLLKNHPHIQGYLEHGVAGLMRSYGQEPPQMLARTQEISENPELNMALGVVTPEGVGRLPELPPGPPPSGKPSLLDAINRLNAAPETPGERTGQLPLYSKEQAALRGQLGAEGQHIAQEFYDPRAEQMQGIIEGASTHPTTAVAAAQERLAQIAQQTHQGVRQAYDTASQQPGVFLPEFAQGAHNAVYEDISRDSQPGAGDRVIVNPQTTPRAAQAINDLQNFPKRIEGATGMPDMEGQRQVLSKLRNDAYSSARSTGSYADAHAMDRIVDSFDNYVSATIKNGMFSGNQDAAQLYELARSKHSDFRQRFTSQTGDFGLGRIMQDIVGSPTGGAAREPSEITHMVMGLADGGETGTAIRLAQQVKNELGENSPEWDDMRRGYFSHILQGADVTQPGTVANRIRAALQGSEKKGTGNVLSQIYFSPEEREGLLQFADKMDRIKVPQAGANWPNTAGGIRQVLQSTVKEAFKGMLAPLGAVLGNSLFPGIGGMFGGALAGTGAERILERRFERGAEKRGAKAAGKVFKGPIRELGDWADNYRGALRQKRLRQQREGSLSQIGRGAVVTPAEATASQHVGQQMTWPTAPTTVVPPNQQQAGGYDNATVGDYGTSTDQGNADSGWESAGGYAGYHKPMKFQRHAHPVYRIGGYIDAYHGSPHNFNQFERRDYTGEGSANDHGEGIYTAESPRTAESYRRPNTDLGQNWQNLFRHGPDNAIKNYGEMFGVLHGALTNGGMHPDLARPVAGSVLDAIQKHGTLDEAMRDLPADRPEYKKAIEHARAMNLHSAPGVLYHVRIGSEPEHFLDWESPLSAQSAHVQNALKGHPNVTGSELYSKLGSKALHAAGVAGVRYPDKYTQGHHNYVVFDPHTMSILDKGGYDASPGEPMGGGGYDDRRMPASTNIEDRRPEPFWRKAIDYVNPTQWFARNDPHSIFWTRPPDQGMSDSDLAHQAGGQDVGGYDDSYSGPPSGVMPQPDESQSPPQPGVTPGRFLGAVGTAVKQTMLDPLAKDIEASVPYHGRELSETAAPLWRALGKFNKATPGRGLPGLFIHGGGGYVGTTGVPQTEAEATDYAGYGGYSDVGGDRTSDGTSVFGGYDDPPDQGGPAGGLWSQISSALDRAAAPIVAEHSQPWGARRALDVAGQALMAMPGPRSSPVELYGTAEQAPGASWGLHPQSNDPSGFAWQSEWRRQPYEDMGVPTRTTMHQGWWQGQSNPVEVSRVLGSVDNRTGELTPESSARMNAGEAVKGYLDAQDASAWHRVLPHPKGTSLAIDSGEPPDSITMEGLNAIAERHGYGLATNPRGVSFLDFGEGDPDSALAALKSSYPKSNAYRGKLASGYIDYSGAAKGTQGSGAATQVLMDKLSELQRADPEAYNKLLDSEGVSVKALGNMVRLGNTGMKGQRPDYEAMLDMVAHGGLARLARRVARFGTAGLPGLFMGAPQQQGHGGGGYAAEGDGGGWSGASPL